MADTLPFKEQKEIIQMFLIGEDPKKIAKQYDITTNMVTSIVKSNPVTRTEIEKTNLSLHITRENTKIADLKLRSLDLLGDAIDEAATAEDKQKFVQNFNGWFSNLDKTFRLNNDMATENKQTQHVKFDVAKILKELKTPEQKKEFLLNQLEKHKNITPTSTEH